MNLPFLNVHGIGVFNGKEAKLDKDVEVEQLLIIDLIQFLLGLVDSMFEDFVDNVSDSVFMDSEVCCVFESGHFLDF